MSKDDLIKEVARLGEFSPGDVEAVLAQLTEVVIGALGDDREVELGDLGFFRLAHDGTIDFQASDVLLEAFHAQHDTPDDGDTEADGDSDGINDDDDGFGGPRMV